MRNARGPCASSASASVVKLPSDFDIFSPPTWTIPLWIQWRANAWPAPSACARSFSWCGNTRSSPPPWRSKPSPSRSSDIAEHSMCQPGRPGPHGESHAGSPGFAAFQSAKSTGLRFASSTSTRAPADSSSCSSVRCGSAPYDGNDATSK